MGIIETAICRPYKCYLDKRLHGTYTLDGDHQQRSGRQATTYTLERQVLTLTIAVERLTRQNQTLEEQLRQKNAVMGNQEEDQEGASADRKNQERPKGNNAPSRLEQQNISLPALMDAAPPIVAEMQAMKEQMEVMMNALKGRVSSDLDDLVNQTDSLFTTSINCFPLPHKFCMP